MNKIAGIILAGGNNERLGELTAERATSALPVAGAYRAIDFTLSNMTNSGIKKVAVITQYNSRSLRDHVSSAKWWDFGSKQGGLFVFSPYTTKDGSLWFRGTADSIYQNMTYLHRSNEDYIVIVNGNGIYKMDYSKIVDYHVRKGADITLVYEDIGNRDVSKIGVMGVDEDGVVTEFEEKPISSELNKVSMGIYVIKRTLLMDLLENIINQDFFDITRDIVIRHMKQLKICGYEFEGYWNAITSVDSYYKINMDFLKKEIRHEFFVDGPAIYTKPKDLPPVKHNLGARVKNTIAANGAIINGIVENSVLFRNVYTGDNSAVRNSVILEGTNVGNNCVIEYAIIDKEATITDNTQLIGSMDKPIIITKGKIV